MNPEEVLAMLVYGVYNYYVQTFNTVWTLIFAILNSFSTSKM